jgi:hypothetical protein
VSDRGPLEQAATRPLTRVIEFLKDYKELFTILGIFASASLWIFGYFATKEELGVVRDSIVKDVGIIKDNTVNDIKTLKENTLKDLGELRETTIKRERVLNCLLDEHVQRLQAEHESKVYHDDLLAVEEDLRRQTPRQGQPSEIDLNRVTRLGQQRDDIKRRLESAEKLEADAKGAIMFGECEKK